MSKVGAAHASRDGKGEQEDGEEKETRRKGFRLPLGSFSPPLPVIFLPAA
jgi:hypothetical protein